MRSKARSIPANVFAPAAQQSVHIAKSPQTAGLRRPSLDSLGTTMLNRLTDSLNFQTQALTLRAERQRLLASNIANADTPGYQSKDFDFSRALREATSEVGSSGANAGLSVTAAGHMNPSAGMSKAQAAVVNGLPSQTSMDSNTVDMDRERASFADNSVKYEATLRFINASVRTTLDAMKSPNAA